MAKKKKAPAAPPLRCFAGTSIAIIGGNIGQRKIWAAKTGCVEIDANPEIVVVADDVDRTRQIDTSATLVAESWLQQSLARGALEDPAVHPWRSVSPPPAAPSPPPKRARLDGDERGLVIVAVGLPGAGKTRFHKRYLAGCDVVHCCQDLLGRSRCLALVEETARAGKVAYVDRCDGYPEQRAPWVEIAKRCKVEVVALRFTADASTCIQRAKAREAQGEHDSTLKSDFARVILKHRSEAEPIGEDEGFDRVYVASEDDDGENAALVDELLGRAPTLPAVVPDTAAVPGTTDAPAASDAPSLPDTTDAIEAFTLAPAEPSPRDVPGYDVDEPRHAKIVDNVITAADAERLIELAAGARDPYTGEQGYRWADLNGEMRRDHRKSDRVIINAPPQLARSLFERLRSGLPETTTDTAGARWRLAELNPYLRVLRYRPGDFFLGHPDGHYPRQYTNRRSFMTVLLYLNEGYRGGFTTIYDSAGRALPVTPRTGMALVHHHRVWHEVPMLREGVKHVIRTDVMYERVFE